MAGHFAFRLSLIAFATASLRGLIGGTDFSGGLKTALVAAALFYGLGLIVGEMARRVVEEHVQAEFDRRNNRTPATESGRQ